MDAELTGIVTAAACEAEARLGESFTGCDGKTYVGVFYAPDAFAMAAAGLEMTQHGFADRTSLALICTRAQFASPPISWRRSKVKIVRTSLTPSPQMTVAHVTFDDPIHYGFLLTNFEPPA